MKSYSFDRIWHVGYDSKILNTELEEPKVVADNISVKLIVPPVKINLTGKEIVKWP
jgi:hypothetical protein